MSRFLGAGSRSHKHLRRSPVRFDTTIPRSAPVGAFRESAVSSEPHPARSAAPQESFKCSLRCADTRCALRESLTVDLPHGRPHNCGVQDRKSTRLNSSHQITRMPSSA